jgi:hypothetical protein
MDENLIFANQRGGVNLAFPPAIAVDTNHEMVKQNEFKKIYRAKEAKIAKATTCPRL